MTKVLYCADTGVQCPYVARGETEEEVLMDASQHGKAVHGYTDEQLTDSKMIADLKKLIKEK
ncbi:MAG: DUF1059 domain-containing protein [Methanomassiliicoccales archaeon]|nr:MAG: DUF1059 domain-containing protein [Methanomassiliicoccales archaeon]